MEEQQLTHNTLQLVQQHLQISHDEILGEQSQFSKLEELKEQLYKMVLYLLDYDLNRLINAVYRIDLNEELFKQAMNQPSKEEIANQVTELIIEREIQKVHLREKYKNF